jgi:hypothetical protein
MTVKMFSSPRVLFPACLMLLAAGTPLRGQTTLAAQGVTLVAQANGGINVLDSSGTNRMLFNGLGFRHGSDDLSTDGGVANLVDDGGRNYIEVSYAVRGSNAGGVSVCGRFTPGVAGNLNIYYRIQGTEAVSRVTLKCNAVPSAGPEKTTVNSGVWKRHDGGGAPYEAPGIHGYKYAFPDFYALLNLPGGYLPWGNNLKMTETSPGIWEADADYAIIKSPGIRVPAAAAVVNERGLGLDVWTSRPFNLWSDHSEPLRVYAQIYNNNAQSSVTLDWWARDFSGAVVARKNVTGEIAQGTAREEFFDIPAPARGILFVEVSVSDGGGQTVFARTNLAVLPPTVFNSGDESIFGLANTFQQPSGADELALLRRMGVRWLRIKKYSDAELAGAGLHQLHHANNTAWRAGPVPDDWIAAELASAVATGAPFWEVSNEMNMSGDGINSGDMAAEYVNNFLIPVKNLQRTLTPGVKIMNGGLAGMDKAFTAGLHAAGAWDILDAFAIHAGRGNYTPDYPGRDGLVSNPSYWSFLGTIENARAALDLYGEKPLYITEAYACTFPNSTWRDSIRHAAENVLLSYAIALAEGVRVMFWYQLNDSVWTDVGGVDETDAEYHFGLLNRDLGPKPSLLAYCTAAEALDQAGFSHWMKFEDPDIHGLMFTTPRGPMAVMWSRAEGYVLNNTPETAEPWVNPWPAISTTTLPAGAENVTVIDCIGQRSSVAVADGEAVLSLDGAPRIIYGLSPMSGRAVVVDNESSAVTIEGDWVTANLTGGFLGRNYWHDGNTGKGAKSVTYPLAIAVSGKYVVKARWTSGSNRAGNVPYIITHAGGSDTVFVNQRAQGREWVVLGEYDFAAGQPYSITISNAGTDGYVIADAVILVPVVTTVPPPAVDPPVIQEAPVENIVVTEGRAFSLGISVSSSVPVVYQWQIAPPGNAGWSNLEDDEMYMGANTAALTVSNVPPALHGTQWRCMVSNAGGFVTSDPARLHVSPDLLPRPARIAVDESGLIHVAEAATGGLWKLAPGMSAGIPTGTVSPLTESSLLAQPRGIVADTGAGCVYEAVTESHIIQKTTSGGITSTLAGQEGVEGCADGPGAEAQFNHPRGLAVDRDGNIAVADTGNSLIRKVSRAGLVETIAGYGGADDIPGATGFKDGGGTAAWFDHPEDVAADGQGNLYVADTGNSAIRRIDSAGQVRTLALVAAQDEPPPNPPAGEGGGSKGGGGGGPTFWYLLVLGGMAGAKWLSAFFNRRKNQRILI